MTSEEYKLKLGDKVEIDGDLWVWERVRRGVEATLRRDGAEDDWLVISMPELIGLASIHRWGGLLSWRRNAEMPL